jgi:hypothetical protein
MRHAIFLLMTACGGRVNDVPDGGHGPFVIPPPDAGRVDADNTRPDADIIDSGSPDAGALWCDGFPFEPLCDDFDHAIEPGSQWSLTGSPLLVLMPHQSAPKSLRMETGSYVSVTSSKPAKSAKLEAEVYVQSDGTSGGNATLLSIEEKGGRSVAMELVPGTSLARCVVKGFDSAPTYDFTLSRGVWHAVTLKISSDIVVTCSVDNAWQSWPVTTSSPFGTITEILGVRGATASAATAYVDNVLPMFEE